MQIRDLSQPVSSSVLNENVAKKFGYKLNLEQFNDVQLEDVRNKLRTELSQYEVNESFDALHNNPKYQKTRALLDVINQAILEREMNEGKGDGNLANNAKPYDKVTRGDVIAGRLGKDEMGGKKKKKNESAEYYSAALRQKAQQHSVPSAWIDSAISRINLGESDQEELAAELTLRYDLSEATAHKILYLAEGEAEKAEIIMSTKDMVGRVTGWLEDVAAMKAEQLLELLDSIRETQGNDVAQQYQDAVKPALESLYAALEQSRQGLNNGLSILTGGAGEMMGATPGGAAPGAAMPPLPGESEPMPGAEPGAEEMGPEEPAVTDTTRAKRESVDYSRKLGMLLASNITKKK
jgi:hypothetical protein